MIITRHLWQWADFSLRSSWRNALIRRQREEQAFHQAAYNRSQFPSFSIKGVEGQKFMRRDNSTLAPLLPGNDNNDGDDLHSGYLRLGGGRVQHGRARVSELMLLDGQNYVYLRHVYMEQPLDNRLKLSSCQPTDPPSYY